MLPTWLLTVASVTTSRSAISVFESPRATSRSTSRSRGVICSRSAGGGSGGAVRAGGEVLDQPAGDRGREQRLAAVDDADRLEQALAWCVFEQEAGGAGAQ